MQRGQNAANNNACECIMPDMPKPKKHYKHNIKITAVVINKVPICRK